jgi:hypothetical protein
MYKSGVKAQLLTSFTDTGTTQYAEGNIVSVTFLDNNSYVGRVQSISPKLTISFLHSNNTYSFDPDKTAHRAGGSYDGKKYVDIRLYRENKNDNELSIGLRIQDAQHRIMNGKFGVRIQAVTGGIAPEVYSNENIFTYSGLGQDRANIQLEDGSFASISVSFSPAINNDRAVDSLVDEETVFYGTKAFRFNKSSKTLQFTASIDYEIETITASSKEEAIETVYNLKNSGWSATGSAKVSATAKLDFLVAGATVGAEVSASGTVSGGTNTGKTDGTVTGTATATTWTVRYPIGLSISQDL